MLCALIMAGGRGTRFWPASTDEKPKQFINLIGDKTMIQMTVDRLLPLIPMERIFICTGERYSDLVKEQLPSMPESNVIIEPTGRNTAPCILLSSLYINQKFDDAEVIVLPSDHVINDEKEFLNIIDTAHSYVLDNSKAIVTIGISPDRPETGYGYIKLDHKVSTINERNILKVERFVEKPNLEVAKEYLADGHYLWNAGMFAFKAASMINEFISYKKNIYDVLVQLPSIEDANYMNALTELYAQCESISIDYAIIEKSSDIYVVPGDFGWDDVGAWKALERYLDIDANNNITKGNVLLDNSKDSIVYSQDKKIILHNVDNLCVIQSGDYIIVSNKDDLTHVHEFRGKL